MNLSGKLYLWLPIEISGFVILAQFYMTAQPKEDLPLKSRAAGEECSFSYGTLWGSYYKL